MLSGRIVAVLGSMLLGALILPGSALAGCLTQGTSIGHCDTTGVTATSTALTSSLTVSDLAITGIDEDTGFITYHDVDSPSDLSLALEGVTITSPDYLGVDIRTNLGGKIEVNTDADTSIFAAQTGIYARAESYGDVDILNYAYIHAGIGGEAGAMPSSGITAVSNFGNVNVENHGDIDSDGTDPYSDYSILANGGYYTTGAAEDDPPIEVTVTNYGEINSAARGIRAVFGRGDDLTGIGIAKVINHGDITAAGERGISVWSQQGSAVIENDANVTVLDGDGLVASVGDEGLDAETSGGDVNVTNAGKVIAGGAGIRTLSYFGDVSITNSGTVAADSYGDDCGCTPSVGTVQVQGEDLGTVTITNTETGLITADSALSEMSLLPLGQLPTLEQMAEFSASATGYAIAAGFKTVGTATVENDGIIIGNIAFGSYGINGDSDGISVINNRAGWITHGINGGALTGGSSINNEGTIWSMGSSVFLGDMVNSGAIVVSSLADEGGSIGIMGDYAAEDDARLLVDMMAGSMLSSAPALFIIGEVSGQTEIMITRGEALADFDWSSDGFILVAAAGSELGDASHFYMEGGGYGLLQLKLVYASDGSGETWSLVYDTTDGTDTLTEIPFAARNLFALATSGVTERLDELRDMANGATPVEPMGYAAAPSDPLVAALALPTSGSSTSTGAWFKTTGRYGEGDAYTTTLGVIEAGIDATTDTGSGMLSGGVFGGMGWSQLGFDLADTEATLTGPLAGAYANYSSGSAFLGVIGAVQSLDVDATLAGAPASFGGLTYGGRVDAGYRFGDELIVEPGLALAASHTEFDSFSMNSAEVGFVDTDSLTAEARLRFSRGIALDTVTLTPFAIATVGNEFLGGNGVTGSTFDTKMGNDGGLYGDLAAGLTVGNADGTLNGTAQGNIGYAAGELSGGLRLGANAAF